MATMDILLRKSMRTSMSPKRQRKLSEIRKMVEGPMQSNWLRGATGTRRKTRDSSSR